MSNIIREFLEVTYYKFERRNFKESGAQSCNFITPPVRKPTVMPTDDEVILVELQKESELSASEARLYLTMLRGGSVLASQKGPEIEKLLDRGMVILSGDNRRYIPVHPRLAIANHFRTWREQMVRDINSRRMRVDKLILRLIPLYEATTEKRLAEGRSE